MNIKKFSGSGVLVLRDVDVGSKSERKALVLVTEKNTYSVRREGAKTMGVDPDWAQLVEQRVSAVGRLAHGTTLILSSLTPISPSIKNKKTLYQIFFKGRPFAVLLPSAPFNSMRS